MRLYYAMGTFQEFATWAKNRRDARNAFKQAFKVIPAEITDQTTNGNFKKIITDKTKPYYRMMDDTREWTITKY